MTISHAVRIILILVLLASAAGCASEGGGDVSDLPSPTHIPALDFVFPSPPATVRPRVSRSAPVRSLVPAGGSPAPDVWERLARCESGMHNDSGAPFYGYFQFMLGTWRGIGEIGNPIDYDYAHQRAAAQRLYARSGPHQWPVCSRRVGLT